MLALHKENNMPNIYDEKAWKRLVATAGAVTYNAHSTYVDGRAGNSTVAFPLDGTVVTSGHEIIFVAYEPPINRWHILRSGAS